MRCHRPTTRTRIPKLGTSVLSALIAGAALAACGGAAAPSGADRATLQRLQKSVLAAYKQGPDLVTADVFHVRRPTVSGRVYTCRWPERGSKRPTTWYTDVMFSRPSAGAGPRRTPMLLSTASMAAWRGPLRVPVGAPRRTPTASRELIGRAAQTGRQPHPSLDLSSRPTHDAPLEATLPGRAGRRRSQSNRRRSSRCDGGSTWTVSDLALIRIAPSSIGRLNWNDRSPTRTITASDRPSACVPPGTLTAVTPPARIGGGFEASGASTSTTTPSRS